MKPLAEVKVGDVLASGIFPGLEGEGGPLWRDGVNVIFDNGQARKDHGLTGLENLAVMPTGAKATVAGGEPRLFIGGGTEAYRYRSSDGLTNIGSFSTTGGVYQFVPWDTWALISNGSDPVELWQNAGTSAAITAPFNRANTIFRYQLQAFAAGTNNGGQLVEWSPINSVTDWTVTLIGTAGNLRLRELEGDIVAAKPIGGSIGIYSNSNGGLFSFIGGSARYGFRRPIDGVSAISPYSIVASGDRHFGVTQENFFVTDLISYVVIDEPAVRRYVQDNVDWSRMTEVYGWLDHANSMARWALPKNDGGKFGIGYRFDRGSWTRFDSGVLLGEQAGPFSNMFLLKSSKLLRRDRASVNNDGSAYESWLRTKHLDLGDRNRFKRVMKISLDMVWSGTVNVKIGWADHPNDSINWVTTLPAMNEIYPDQLGFRSEGAFMAIEIYSNSVGANWRLNGASVYGDYTGYVN